MSTTLGLARALDPLFDLVDPGVAAELRRHVAELFAAGEADDRDEAKRVSRAIRTIVEIELTKEAKL
jgi:hypothetical protein